MKTRMTLIAGAFALSLAACAGTNPPAATEVLEDAGYTDVEITGLNFFGCGAAIGNTYLGSPIEHTGFTATALSGRRVSGTVCRGSFGDYTTRLQR